MEVNWNRSSSGGGLNYVKWSMDLPRDYWHPAFAIGTRVELYRGDMKLGSATLAEPDRVSWKFVADGLYKQGDKFQAAVGGFDSSNFQQMVQNAIDRGLGWNGIGNIPNIDVDQASTDTVAGVMTSYCQANALRWGLTVEDVPFIEPDPYLYHPDTVPGWALTPGTPLMPISDDAFATRANVLYYVGGIGGGTYGNPQTYASAASAATGDLTLPGGHEITVVGNPAAMSGAEAQLLADELMRQKGLRYAFTEGLDVIPGELTTPGGTAIDNWAAFTLLGQMGNHQGAINRLNNVAVGQTVQWVMGTVTYRPAEDRLRIGSVDMDPRDYKGLMANMFQKLTAGQSYRGG